tara:strand:- start:345 stop:1511 length:1167 start_codon:yes stop_codon:yes gene_type:complete
MPYIGRTLGQGTRSRFLYTATAGQTTFSGSDSQSNTLAYSDNSGLDCFQNGVLLKGGGADYTATSGTSVVLTTGASVNDVIEILVYDVFAIADHVKKSGDAMTGALTNIDVNGTELILDADGDTSITSDTDDQVDIKVGGTDRAVFLANNMHLIGGTVARVQLSSSGSGATPNTGNNNIHIEGNDDTLVLNSAGNGNIIFQENGTEHMRINNSGYVGIGTSSPVADLHVVGGHLQVNSETNSGSTVHHYSNTTSGGAYRVRFDSNSSVVGSIAVGTSSTAYNTSSDYRLKENVVTDWDATTRLKQLKPSRFNFKIDKDTTVDGFIAHEVSSIVPEAISGTKDAVDKEGNIEPQSIDQSKLVPLLTKALQEAVAKIEILEAKVTALEGK